MQEHLINLMATLNKMEVKMTKEEMAKIYNNAGLDCEIIYNKTKEEVNEK